MTEEIVESLRQQLGLARTVIGLETVNYVSTGCPAWDAWLLHRKGSQADLRQADLRQAERVRGGFRRGQLVEWLSANAGHGVGTLALWVAGRAATEGRVVVVIDRDRWFYPPAALALGLDLSRLILLHPRTAADEIWALDQSLRCPAVGAVWSPIDRLDRRDFRRLQLAAQQGGTLGLLLRPGRVRGEPSWSDMQLLVTAQRLPSVRGTGRDESRGDARVFGSQQPARRCWKVSMLRCRRGVAGNFCLLEMDEMTGQLHWVKACSGELERESETE